jgi:hypothetical protein
MPLIARSLRALGPDVCESALRQHDGLGILRAHWPRWARKRDETREPQHLCDYSHVDAPRVSGHIPMVVRYASLSRHAWCEPPLEGKKNTASR